MKKYFIVSLLLHLLPLIVFVSREDGASPITPEKQAQQQANKARLQANNVEIQVIEQTLSAPKEDKKEKKFYWGIGVSIDQIQLQVPGMVAPITGVLIERVYSGYCAEAAGITEKDVIIMINGEFISPNSDIIVGDGPKKLVLTILRNNSIIRIQVERCKVEYNN